MIKKWFFDYWDHFFHCTIINVVFIFSLLIPIGIPAWTISASIPVSLIILIAGILWLGILTSAAALYINEIVQYRTPEPRQFFAFLRAGLPYGLLYAGLWALVFFLALVVLPFYGAVDNIFGIIAFVCMFWTLILLTLAMQYYFPIVAQLDKRPGKILRKMFIIFLDNPLFTISTFLCSVIMLILSGFTAFLLFGPAGVILLGQVACKLRLYKYDYLEENPGASRRRIPWQSLMYEDSQRVGSRSLKGLIFPWKD
ncbi:MAG: hypothetical protein ACR2PY_07680 [Salinispira sp.]